MIHPFLQDKLSVINKIFEESSIKKAYVFGSIVNGDFNEKSDIDFIVSFKDDTDPIKQGELWWSLSEKLSKQLNRNVDILIEKPIRNKYLAQEIEKYKEVIYG